MKHKLSLTNYIKSDIITINLYLYIFLKKMYTIITVGGCDERKRKKD